MAIQIVALVDESWSMNPKRKAVIEGINTFIDEQKKAGEGAEFSLFYFNSEFRVISYRIPLKDAQYLTEETYAPGGSTLLLDSIGNLLTQFKHLQESHADEVNGVVIAIMTDGEETVASKNFTTEQIKTLTTELQEKYKWEVNYLGANQDSFSIATALGITNSYNFADTENGVRGSMKLMSASSALYRAARGAVAEDYYMSNKNEWEQTVAQAKTEGIK